MNVYDFDETIYDGESSVEFFLFYLRRDPSLIKYFPDVIKALFLYKREKISLNEFLDEYLTVIEDYVCNNKGRFEKSVIDFWDKKMHKIKPFYLSRKREDDVIISASPNILLNEICSRLGIKNLICTSFDLESGKFQHACFRESKIDRFKEAYPDCRIDEFYTDSMNDKFLMPFADKVFIVKGNRIEQIK